MCRIDLGSAQDWVRKGQGNANVVFAYAGADNLLVGRVLRVCKVPKGSVTNSAHLSIDQLTRDIWGTGLDDIQDVSQQFAAVLGTSKHMLSGVQVQLPQELQTGLSSQSCSNSNSSCTAAQTSLLSSTAYLLPDCTILPPAQSLKCIPSNVNQIHSTVFHKCTVPHKGLAQGCKAAQPAMESQAPVMCIELKPKWGLLPTSPAIPIMHEVKKQKSRFQLHQALKLAQGKIKSLSSYDPLDLFSTDPSRMQHALKALLACPQNNLKLFLNGQPLQLSDDASSLHQIGAAVCQALSPHPDLTDASNTLELLATVLQQVLSRTGVLQKLLSIQALDVHDIEGVYPLYQHVLQQLGTSSGGCTSAAAAASSKPTAAEQQSGDALQPCGAYIQQLVNLGWSQQMSILRDYLLATTSKDCSLMIALQAVPQACLQLGKDRNAQVHDSLTSQELLSTPALTCPLQFKLTIVDLDRKPHAKIAAHYRLDQEITCCELRRHI